MAGKIIIEKLGNVPITERKIEFVERKGLGHPDYIADSIAEAVSLGLSKYYLNEFGRILHHNVDKVLIVGGQAAPRFKGGIMLTPIFILVAGRITTIVKTEEGLNEIPVGEIILDSSKKWISENFRFLDPYKHVIIDYRIGKGSSDLKRLVESNIPLSNDTSLGVSYAPLSPTEKIVLNIEKYLNSKSFKEKYPVVGEDIKVMGLRHEKKLKLTIAIAMISKFIDDKDSYFNFKDEIRDKVFDYVIKNIEDIEIESIDINTADNRSDIGSLYMVVTGTSAEHGDDGMTGRGNRVNGLITPLRPMSLEATAGKNPVSHVGKIYNVLARLCANDISKIDGVREVYVKFLSQIGKPINQPLAAYVSIITYPSVSFNNIRYESESIIEEKLENIREITDLILNRKIEIY